MNFRADRAGGVSETVAREDVVFEWVLLEDLLAEIGFSKELGTIGAVVHRWAVGSRRKKNSLATISVRGRANRAFTVSVSIRFPGWLLVGQALMGGKPGARKWQCRRLAGIRRDRPSITSLGHDRARVRLD